MAFERRRVFSETERLAALRGLGVLDTAPTESFDRLTALAADLFAAPIGLVSLVDADRQWFKSRHGLEACSTPRDQAFCAYALPLDAGGVMVVEDATLDPRFCDNPLVVGAPGIRFYVGAVLTDRDGHSLGTLCVIDTVPRPRPSDADLSRLATLAKVVAELLELSRSERSVREQHELLSMAEHLSGVGHWRMSFPDAVLEWSDEMFAIYGKDPATFTPTFPALIEMVHPADREGLRSTVAAAFETRSPYALEIRLLRPDGEIRHVTLRGGYDVDDAGELRAVLGVAQDVTVYLSAVRAAKRNEGRYRLLADHCADVITRVRLDGRSSYISPAIEGLLGYKPEEMTGGTALDFLVEEDRCIAMDGLARLARGEAEVTTEMRALHKSGQVVWVETRVSLVRDATGRPYESVAVIRDINERKRAEAALREASDEAQDQAKRAAMAEEVGGLGHWRFDLADESIVWSDQMRRICGIDPDFPLTLATFRDLVPEEDIRETEGRMARARRGEPLDKARLRIRTPAGDLRHLDSNLRVEMRDGQAVAVVGTVMDVTAQAEAEQILAASEARYRMLAETARDLIMHTGSDGRLRYVSPACETVFGYKPEALIGQRVTDMVHPDDLPQMTRKVRRHLSARGAEALRLEFRARRADGAYVWVEGNAIRTFDKEGRYIGMTDVLRDVTERKQMEAELYDARSRAEAAAAVKGEFLANMSHELRTPLTAVLGFTRLAQEQAAEAPHIRTALDKAVSAGKALLSTVNDILDFSKLEAGQVSIRPVAMSPSDVVGNVLDVLSLQAAAKGLDLSWSAEDGVPALVRSDPDRIRQILLNVVGNAVKFTQQGSVAVRLSRSGDDGLRFDVTDTGPGVPAEELERLFQRFSQVDGSSTRRHGGTGLGLAICRGLAEAMGGETGVESTPGEGSTFWFSVHAPAAADAPTAGAATGLEGCRILVVDDNSANRELASAFLSPFQPCLETASDGAQAVEAAEAMPFDVILMDVRMPGMSGPQAARLIRDGRGPNRDIPILAFSAEPPNPAWASLFDGYVAKPVSAAALISALVGAVGSASESITHVA